MSLMLFLKAGLGDDGKFDISAGRGYNPRHECDEWHCETTPDAPGNKRRGGLVHRDRTARQRGEISRRPHGGGRRGMTGEIRNPVRWEDISPDMTEAEKQFAECLAHGRPCVLGDAVPAAEASDTRNTVRSEVIRFFAFGGDEAHPVRGAHITLRGARIPPQPSLDLIHARIPYLLGFFDCLLETNIFMVGAQCASLSLAGSHLRGDFKGDGATIDGNLLFRGGFIAEGEMRLIGAHIGGFWDCDGGKFINPGKAAIVADGITVNGNVWLREGFSAKGEVRLPTARIGGEMDCGKGVFNNPQKCALCADGATVRSRIAMRGISVVGEIRLVGAHTDGQLDCEGGCFDGADSGVSFRADGMTALQGIALRKGFSSNGEVRLLGARTDENLDCTSGQFRNPEEKALGADNIHVGGTVFLLGDDFHAEGEVRLPNARIGALECGGMFVNQKAIALGASDMEVARGVTLDACFRGEVLLVGTRIKTSLSMQGMFDNPQGVALNAERIEVKQGILWAPCGGGGDIHFGFSKIGVLAEESNAWKSFSVALDGFVYEQFANPMDARSRIAWLSSRPPEIPFSPLPYEQAAKVLFGMGRANDAREILLEKERLKTKDRRTPWHHKIGRWLWDECAGYGYRLRRTIAWSLAVIVIGWGVFSHTAETGGIVPHQPAILASPNYQEAVDKGIPPMKAALNEFPEYPEFNPLAFSADVFIPVFALRQEPSWYPVARDKDAIAWLFGHPEIYGLAIGAAILGLSLLATLAGLLSLWGRSAWLGEWVLRRVCPLIPRMAVALCLFALGLASPKHWYWLEIGFGWGLTSLFLLSITGLLRPRQSSGEKG